ncbi:YTA7 ATPase histone chaperone YTA7 [Candida maltosa Xu316]
MGKRGRPKKYISDDDEFVHGFDGLPPRRATKTVSYKESDNDDEDDVLYGVAKTPVENGDEIAPAEGLFVNDDYNEEVQAPKEEEVGDVDDDDDEADFMPQPKRRKGPKLRRSRVESDDEEFRDEGAEESEEDDLVLSDDDELGYRKKKEDNFVVKDPNDEWDDEYDDDEEDGYGSKPKKKRGRKKKSLSRYQEPKRTTRSGRPLDNGEDNTFGEATMESDGELDIQKEIAELYDSSPGRTGEDAPAHKLRQRAKVDYTIPPPITNDFQLEREVRAGTPSTVRNRRGRAPAAKSDFRKILYPTAGPFGGSDVISLFGTNIPPAGIPIPGLANNPNLTAIGQNAIDSDSSEDEIAPINGEATVSKKQPKTRKPSISGTKLISGGSDDSTKKKKNLLSDTDPLEMVALPLLYPELYQNFGITPPRGVLFHGPPGTGKTLMARALAASCSTAERKITFFMRKGADCLSKWVGEAERQLRLLFEEAKNQQPSIIFFDEIDGLAPVRSSKQEQIHASIVSTLLALMDGMDNRGQVIVIGATNRPDAIDPALRRPGRFDREFYFPLPDITSRKEILKIHTRKWTPQLPDIFLERLAELTKGYGGADLRALCTEAALNSIQRKYPQIYETNEKLLVHPSKVKVIAKDFMKAIEKIVPSSARSTSSGSAPLPEHLKPLLEKEYDEIVKKLDQLLPNSVSLNGKKKLTALDEAKYLDPTIKDEDGGFAKQQLLKNLENSRICRPHLLICGEEGNGQQYLSAAVLNHLEGFQVQSLDLGTMFGEPTRTPESTIVQAFIEARRHQPAILFVPNIDIWFQVLPEPAKATLTSLLRGLKSNEKLLLLGISETPIEELSSEIKLIFGFENSANNVLLHNPKRANREAYFSTLKKTLLMKPYEFVNDIENRPKRKLKELKVVKTTTDLSNDAVNKKKLKEQEYKDTKLKNVLKIKLAALMDLFKVRYKKFRKPIIDENFIAHLFDPTILDNPLNNYMVLYERSEDPGHENMIKELSTGKYYYNIDLDLIEERLWNGFYSEPKQFLKDLKMIVKDCFTFGDRERILKANEMMTNAQFGVDDFSTPEFLKACKEVRERDLLKQKKLLEEHEKLKQELEKQQQEQQQVIELDATEVSVVEEPVLVENGSTTVESNGNTEITAENGNDVTMEDVAPSKPVEVNGTIKEAEAESDAIEADKSAPNDTQEIINEEDKHEENKQVAEDVPIVEDEPIVEDKPVTEDDPIVEDKIEEEEESESEAEEEIDIDLTKEVEIDVQQLDTLTNELLEITEDYNVEKLEIVMARIMDVIWRDRNEWNKSSTLENLQKTLEAIKNTL